MNVAVGRFVAVGEAIASENQELKDEMGQACLEARRAGRTVLAEEGPTLLHELNKTFGQLNILLTAPHPKGFFFFAVDSSCIFLSAREA